MLDMKNFVLLVVVIFAFKATEGSEQGRCMTFGTGGTYNSGRHLSLLADIEPQPISNWNPTSKHELRHLCKFSENPTHVCCTERQVNVMHKELETVNATMRNCPTCFHNLAALMCQMSCGIHSQFYTPIKSHRLDSSEVTIPHFRHAKGAPEDKKFPFVKDCQTHESFEKNNCIGMSVVTQASVRLDKKVAETIFLSCEKVKCLRNTKFSLDILAPGARNGPNMDESVKVMVDLLGTPTPTTARMHVQFELVSDGLRLIPEVRSCKHSGYYADWHAEYTCAPDHCGA